MDMRYMWIPSTGEGSRLLFSVLSIASTPTSIFLSWSPVLDLRACGISKRIITSRSYFCCTLYTFSMRELAFSSIFLRLAARILSVLACISRCRSSSALSPLEFMAYCAFNRITVEEFYACAQFTREGSRDVRRCALGYRARSFKEVNDRIRT